MNRLHSAQASLTSVEFVEAWLNQQQLLLAWRVAHQWGSPQVIVDLIDRRLQS
jgi:hypothetical protein